MRNSLDASAVTEEFRGRLQALRGSHVGVDGPVASPAGERLPPRRK